MPDGAERRRYPRTSVNWYQIRLQDRTADNTLGTVANISHNGLLVNSQDGFPVNATLQARLCWHNPDAASQHDIPVGITALWTTAADNAGAFWTGFEIIDISDEDQARLDALIAQESG